MSAQWRNGRTTESPVAVAACSAARLDDDLRATAGKNRAYGAGGLLLGRAVGGLIQIVHALGILANASPLQAQRPA